MCLLLNNCCDGNSREALIRTEVVFTTGPLVYIQASDGHLKVAGAYENVEIFIFKKQICFPELANALNIHRLVFESRLSSQSVSVFTIWILSCWSCDFLDVPPPNGSYLGFPDISMGNCEIHLECIDTLHVPSVLSKASGNTQQH